MGRRRPSQRLSALVRPTSRDATPRDRPLTTASSLTPMGLYGWVDVERSLASDP
jgi:hypothetical protein